MENESLRVGELFQRRHPVRIEVDGELVDSYEGETIAAALTASGRRIFRYTASGQPRGIFCGMGTCFDCLVEVDESPVSGAA